MINYMIRRLLHLVPIILGVALIFFVIFNVIGGQEKFLYNVLPKKSRTVEQIDMYRHKYGLDRPMVVQYLDLVRQMVTFDFGRSEVRKIPVKTLIMRHVPNSAKLTFPAFFLEISISLILASICAYFRGSIFDRTITIFSVLGMSISMLVLILLGQQILAYQWGLFPISGWVKGFGAIRYLILPWILWVLVSVGYDIRFFRTALLEESHKDYVRTARAKGLDDKTIMFRHIMRNAMIPILTYVVIQIPFLLVGSILLERFFSIPGIGDLMVNAVFNYDLPVLKATIMFFTLFFVGFTLITDMLYAFVDPRVRLS
ncbi:MAG: ABC transporter permease [Spirochaetales bacterium]|nr:ABC transporter permease [Spirochaetales bacterium]